MSLVILTVSSQLKVFSRSQAVMHIIYDNISEVQARDDVSADHYLIFDL